MDHWKNKLPRQALGLQLWMLSGFKEDDEPNCRIASDQWSVTIDLQLPSSGTDPKQSFRYLLFKPNGQPKSAQERALIKNVLSYHPKVIARTNSVMKLRGHDHTKKTIWLR